MALLSVKNFTEAQPSQLSVFDLPPTQTAVEKVYFHDVRPISQLSGSSPIEFSISGQNGMEYVDLRNSYICVKVKIVGKNGVDLLPTEYVGPVNLFLQAMFSQVDISMQGRTVTPTTNNYPYKAFIQTLLGYGYGAKRSPLTSQLWIKDSAGHMDDNNVNAGQNLGLFERAKYFHESRVVQLIGPISHDLCKLDRYILNQVGIDIKIYRSKPQFCLMTNELDDDYNFHIEDISMKVCKIQINPAVIYAHSQALQSTNAKYPFTKTDVKMMALAQGQVNFTWDNIFQGMRPNKIVIGFVNSQAVAGSFSLNPFSFANYNLNQITVSVDGIPAEGQPLKVNFESGNGEQTTDLLISLFRVSGKWMNDVGNEISRDDIGGGYALYAFDLEPAFDDSNFLTLIKQGNVRIDVQFGSSLPHPVTCIVYSEASGYFEINLARDVLLE
ncbi:hypothetical protein FSP39_004275 [Pinctada imbricata]|uniref:Uncharacterized protein n=1 Tax=Pinctada imbricata TaxID=66713 RepID=A0AA89CBV2_PINIB|nr:hypothetical protein FSP39_004275 [Pinctada imbricata]